MSDDVIPSARTLSDFRTALIRGVLPTMCRLARLETDRLRQEEEVVIPVDPAELASRVFARVVPELDPSLGVFTCARVLQVRLLDALEELVELARTRDAA